MPLLIPRLPAPRRLFNGLLAGLLFWCAACTPPPALDPLALDLDFQPNILWLVAEDLSPLLEMYGDSTVATPHLSQLGREGVRFDRAFSISGVCAPSRYALAMGRYPTSDAAQHMRTSSRPSYMAQIGIIPYEAQPPPEARMMSEVLRRAGYYTANRAKRDYQMREGLMAWDASGGRAHWRGRAPGQPFFAAFNFGVTHESQVWARAQDSLLVPADLAVPVPPYLPRTEAVLQDVRRVYSNIKLLDAQVGAVLDELAADGLLDSTIVVFYSDHGGPLPRQKRRLYDSGLHVPLLIRFPHAQHGGTTDGRLVSFIDFAPTMFSLAGLVPPAVVQGQAFLGPYQAPPRRQVFAAADRFDTEYDRIRAARGPRFKYLRNEKPETGYYLSVQYREQMATMQELLRLRDAGGLDSLQAQWFRPNKPAEELFDTEADPHELYNLAADPAYADTLAALRAALDGWLATAGDQGAIPEAALVELLWPGGQQPITAAPQVRLENGTLTLTSPTAGASLGYQALPPGAVLTDRWMPYLGPVAVPPSHTLYTVAHRLGYVPSDTVVVRQGVAP